MLTARFSEWLTHAKPLPLNVMLVQLTLSLRTTSGNLVDTSTSREEESAPCLLTGVIVPPESDRLPGLGGSAVPPEVRLGFAWVTRMLGGNEARNAACSALSTSPIGSVSP